MSGSIRAHDLGKKYKRYRGHWHRVLEWATGGRFRGHQERWALRGVSFEVAPGDAVGIVGQNGAGKSTLLKLIVGTTRPSEGSFEVDGQVAALLELGMGLHPEFTGRQNTLMTLQMMGIGRESAQALLPAVAEFSELEDFMEQPLRTYSSGMQMRLGFALATATRPDVLIVDEALSVGDAYFQHKCIRRIRAFKEAGTTMLFVSHDPAAVKTLCDHALLLDQGRLVQEGTAESVLDYYNALIAQREKDHAIDQQPAGAARLRTRSGDRRVTIAGVEMTDAEGRATTSFATGARARLRCTLRFESDLDEYAVGVLIRDRLGNDVFGINTTYAGVDAIACAAGDEVEALFDLDLNLGFGHYSLSVAVHAPIGHLAENYEWIDNALSFQVIPSSSYRFAGVARLPVEAALRKTEGVRDRASAAQERSLPKRPASNNGPREEVP